MEGAATRIPASLALTKFVGGLMVSASSQRKVTPVTFAGLAAKDSRRIRNEV